MAMLMIKYYKFGTLKTSMKYSYRSKFHRPKVNLMKSMGFYLNEHTQSCIHTKIFIPF